MLVSAASLMHTRVLVSFFLFFLLVEAAFFLRVSHLPYRRIRLLLRLYVLYDGCCAFHSINCMQAAFSLVELYHLALACPPCSRFCGMHDLYTTEPEPCVACQSQLRRSTKLDAVCVIMVHVLHGGCFAFRSQAMQAAGLSYINGLWHAIHGSGFVACNICKPQILSHVWHARATCSAQPSWMQVVLLCFRSNFGMIWHDGCKAHTMSSCMPHG